MSTRTDPVATSTPLFVEDREAQTQTRHVKYLDRITIEDGKMGGKPCIRGLRITVYDVLACLRFAAL